MQRRERRRRAEEIAAEAAEEIEMTASIILCDYVGAEDAGRVSALFFAFLSNFTNFNILLVFVYFCAY